MMKNHMPKVAALLLVMILTLALCGTVSAAADPSGIVASESNAVAANGGISAQTRYLIAGGIALLICVGFYIVLSVKTKKK